MDEETKTLSVAELNLKIQEAMAKGNFAEVAKLANQARKAEGDKEKKELEAKSGEIAALTEEVKNKFGGIVDKFGDRIIALVGEKKAVIQLSWNAEDKMVTAKINKGTTRKPGSGGEPIQKFDMSTEQLLELYGDEKYKDDGTTFKEAYESSTDKNVRFNIRRKLIKRHTQPE